MSKKMVPCKVCGHEIAKSAKKCPQCGKKRPLIERNPVGACILIFFILVMFISFVASVLGSDTGEPAAPPASENASVSTPIPDPEPTFDPIPLEVSNWEVTITDFYFADDVDISWLLEYESDENAQYAIVEMTAKNIGKEADTFLPWFAYGDDVKVELKCNGYSYTRSELWLANDALSTEDLNPLVSASGIVVFNFPYELIESDAQIDIVISSDYKSVTATLR